MKYSNPLYYAHNLYINDVLQKEITIPQEITEIKAYTFEGCNATSVKIHNGVTSIGWSAFYGCSYLTSITIPASVTSIDVYAFGHCTNLKTVTFADDSELESIGQNAFYNCSNLTKVYYNGDLAAWCNIDFGNSTANPLNNGVDLYINDVPQQEIIIPREVTEIKAYAFYGCHSIISVTIPASVTSIGDRAFEDCSSLERIDVDSGNTVYSSQDGILYNHAKTEFVHIPKAIKGAVTIPEGITSIGSSAFHGCSNLTGITIPASVTSIGSSAFGNCANLQTATFAGPNGWRVSKNSDMTSATSISSTDLQNSTTAADYLRSKYDDYYWKKY